MDSPGFPEGTLRLEGVARPEGVVRPLGVMRPWVAGPSTTGVRLVTSTTGGESAVEGVVGATASVVPPEGTYIGTVEIGFPKACGAETSGGGETGGALVMGGTTLIGLCGLGRITGGEGLPEAGSACGLVAAGAGACGCGCAWVVAGLAMVMFRVLLALAVVAGAGAVAGALPGAGAGPRDGVEAGMVVVTAGTGAVGLLGWAGAEGATGWAGEVVEGAADLVVAGFRGTVMEDVTTVGADGRVFTTTAPVDLGVSVKQQFTFFFKSN